MTVDKLTALLNICAHYHSGGASRGYRLMCRAAAALARRGVRAGGYERLDQMTARQRRIYRLLEKNTRLLGQLDQCDRVGR